jgi:DNA (cytosine-5)-methyltransferase 1
MLRAIREIQPRWVVGENVRGLTNWNGGVVFDEVQADLEAEGYEITPFLLPACAVNAPHRRDRIWFVAHSNLYGSNQRNSNNEVNASERRVNALSNINKSNGNGDVADTDSRRLERSEEVGWNGINAEWKGKFGDAADTTNIRRENALENGELERGRFGQSYQRNAWDSFPSVSPICNGDDGIPDRLDSITFPKWRNESIKAGGNAIVPQVVYQIFKAIEQYERVSTTNKSS